METKFQALPPLKRFRLLQRQQQQQQNYEIEENKENARISYQLPAKKRKETRDPLLPDPTTTATYCLPAKKRVWALQPDFASGKPFLPLDLNVEYKPCFDEEMKVINVETKETPLAISDSQEKHIPLHSENTQFAEVANQEDKESEKEKEIKGEGNDNNDDDGIVCAICQSTDGDPADPIVFCDGCELMVHTTCYGNPLITGVPEGDWFCSQCLFSLPEEHNKTISSCCCLCPNKGGALKPTTNNGSWAHVVCALLVPEVFFEDPDGREGIDCSKVPKKRWEGKCYMCKSRNGCVIECSEPRCPLAFHVTCGLEEDLCIEYKEGKRKEAIVAGFCKRHTELWEKQQQTGKFKIVARDKNTE